MTTLLLLACLQDPDAQIAEMLRAWERNRQDPTATRVLSTQLQARFDAGAPAATAALIAANRDLPIEARMVAAMSLARAHDARAPEAARELGASASDELLFVTGDDASARQLGERVRGGNDRDQQLREIDYLGRIGTPAAKAAEAGVPFTPVRKPAPPPAREGSSPRTNVILASVAVGLSILLLATRKRA